MATTSLQRDNYFVPPVSIDLTQSGDESDDESDDEPADDAETIMYDDSDYEGGAIIVD